MNPSKPLVWLILLCAVLPAAGQDPNAQLDLRTLPPQEQARFSKARQTFEMMTYRFDDDDGAILSPQSHKPITLAEGLQLLDMIGQGRAWGALERMNAVLQGQDPSKPLPPDKLAKLKAIQATVGPQFPASLSGLLSAAGSGPSKPLLDAFWSHYLEQRGLSDQALVQMGEDAVRAPTGAEVPPVRAAYFDDAERQLGAKFQKAVDDHLSQYDTGGKTLSHFRTAKGALQLPFMLGLAHEGDDWAYYDSGAKSMVLNETHLVEKIVARAPTAEQEALRKRLSNPKRIAEYLAKDDGALADFVAACDVTIVHELTHAWQDRREKIDAAMNRGVLPPADVLEDEQEAFLQQNLFFHEKLLKNPASVVNSDDAGDYQAFLVNFDEWREGISRRYLQLFPHSAATLPQVEDIQLMRMKAAHQEEPGVWDKLKAVFQSGLDVAKESQTHHDDQFSRFKAERYTQVQAQGWLALARGFHQQGKPEYALPRAYNALVLAESGGQATIDLVSSAEAEVASDLPHAVAWLRTFRGDPSTRLGIVDIIEKYHDRGKGQPYPAGYLGGRALAYCDRAVDMLKLADLQKEPKAAFATRQQALKLAAFDQTSLKLIDAEMRDDVARCRQEAAGPFASASAR